MRNFLRRNRRADIRQEGISSRQDEIAESRDALASQELQSSQPRENQPLEVGTNFDRQTLSETSTRGKPPVLPGGDLGKHGLYRRNLGGG